MWNGYIPALVEYTEAICDVWDSKGFKDTCRAKIKALLTPEELAQYEIGDYKMPPWLGDEAFHRSHQSSLVHKSPEIYREQFPDVPDEINYIWPGKTLEEASAEQDAEKPFV